MVGGGDSYGGKEESHLSEVLKFGKQRDGKDGFLDSFWLWDYLH